MLEFDLRALYAALDERRQDRELSWAGVAREVNRFETSGHPIAVSTITALRQAGSGRHHERGEHCDIVLAELVWLDRTPESFLPGLPASDSARYTLPSLDGRRRLRFDTKALHGALNACRQARGLTWRETAALLGVGGAGPLTGLAKGGRTGIRLVMRICQWLERPAADFARPTDR